MAGLSGCLSDTCAADLSDWDCWEAEFGTVALLASMLGELPDVLETPSGVL